MAYNGTIVGTPTFGAAKFGNGLTATSDSNYINLPAGSLSAATSYTVESWLKTTAASVQVAMVFADANSDTIWIGQDGSGHLAVSISGLGGSGGSPTTSSATINDGAWHHCAVTISSTQVVLYVDGVNVGSAALTASVSMANTLAYLGKHSVNGFAWGGGIDEAAIWDGVRYTANFTPPTVAYAGTESGLHALYHLESDGTDSHTVPGLIDPSNAAILYSPYNWSVVSGSATTVNAGAYLRVLSNSTSFKLNFDTSANSAESPQVYARIDGGAWIPLTLPVQSTGTVTVASGLDNQTHLLEAIVKSADILSPRWITSNQPTIETAVKITGLLIDSGATVSAPPRRSKNVLIYGDSITEGREAGVTSASRDVDQDSVIADYSYAMLSQCDCEFGIVAFGGQGITVSGGGGVPPMSTTYNLVLPGVSRTFSPKPDLVIYNQGTNDALQSADPATFQSAYVTIIQAILAAAPNSRHLVMRPLGGQYASYVQAVVAAVGSPRVTYVDTTGWINPDPYSNGGDTFEGLHPLAYAHLTKVTPKMLPVVSNALYPLDRRYSFS